ncbi:MAG TPA: hypothetical protein VM536_16100, partial [Chloroflexia bacterium]|nr:hypothetical protein [Chloroflexia bacterium]
MTATPQRRALLTSAFFLILATVLWMGRSPGPTVHPVRPLAPGGALPAGGTSAGRATEAPSGIVVVHALHNDVSAPLRALPPLSAVPGEAITPPREFPVPVRGPREQASGRDGALQPRPSGPADAEMPAPLLNFAGVGNLSGVDPPDTNGDVGPNHYIQWINFYFQIFDKAGASIYGPAQGRTLWAGFGGRCEASNHGDPIVLYDGQADRWFLSQFSYRFVTGAYTFRQCIAVSTSPDPLGSYNRYDFEISTTQFNDYPKFGVWPDGYYATYNMYNPDTFAYLGPRAVVFDRVRMLAGQPVTMQYVQLSPPNYSLLPA